MTGINPAPSLTLAGLGAVEICTEPDSRGRPALSATAPTALGSLRVRWGRRSVWETPAPATLTASVFDPTGALAERVRDMSVFHSSAEVTIPTPAGDRRLFSGPVADASLTEATKHTTAGDRPGWIIDLTAADWRSRDRNQDFEVATSSNETYRTVVATVFTAFPWLHGLVIDGMIPSRGDLPGASTAPVDLSGPLDSIVEQLAHLAGDHHQWHPDHGRYEIIPVTRPPAGEPQAFLLDLGDHRTTITARDLAWPSHPDDVVFPGTTLHGCELVHHARDDAHAAKDNLIGMVTSTYRTDSGPLVGYPAGSGVYPRLPVQYDLGMPWTWARVLHDELMARAEVDGFGPQHADVEYRTAVSGGFESWTQALTVLRPWETPARVAVTGSPWTRATAAPLLHSIQGGELAYTAGDWSVLMSLRRGGADRTAPAGPTWDDLAAAGLGWGAGPDYRHFIESVTWADLSAGIESGTLLPPQE